MLSVLLVVPEKLSAWGLYQYTRHLAANKQSTERYEIAFWKKIVYPFAALVMMALALPFAYLQVRHRRRRREALRRADARRPVPLPEQPVLAPRACSSAGRRSRRRWCPARLFLALAVAMMWWVERR